MVRQRRLDTAPELELRSALHRRGFRYRVHFVVLPTSRRTVDVAFPRQRVAVDIRGCYWHGCPDHGTEPQANADWWHAKLAANRARDADTETRLAAADWVLLVVWEHEDPNAAAGRVAESVEARRRLY
jgi:DNA mismatch endonuclease, patch repair protein